jgi:hypothetical protein
MNYDRWTTIIHVDSATRYYLLYYTKHLLQLLQICSAYVYNIIYYIMLLLITNTYTAIQYICNYATTCYIIMVIYTQILYGVRIHLYIPSWFSLTVIECTEMKGKNRTE